MRTFLEMREMYESHSCAWLWRAMAIFWAGLGSCLYVRVSGGSSEKETSCAISASVLVWNEPVLLITIGMMTASTFQGLCCVMASFRGYKFGVCGR